jgi:hypothetical protein
MACCSPAKTEQVESKKVETVKAVAAEANAFADSTWCLTPQAASTAQTYGLRCRLAHFELRPHFLDFGDA